MTESEKKESVSSGETEETDGMELQPSQVDPVALEKQKLSEQRLAKIFEDENIKERVKEQLQKIIREELSKMSVTLRESIRAWLIKEKKKYDPERDQQQIKLLDQKVEEIQEENKTLNTENRSLKRKVELQQHENSMILEGLTKLMEAKKKQ